MPALSMSTPDKKPPRVYCPGGCQGLRHEAGIGGRAITACQSQWLDQSRRTTVSFAQAANDTPCTAALGGLEKRLSRFRIETSPRPPLRSTLDCGGGSAGLGVRETAPTAERWALTQRALTFYLQRCIQRVFASRTANGRCWQMFSSRLAGVAIGGWPGGATQPGRTRPPLPSGGYTPAPVRPTPALGPPLLRLPPPKDPCSAYYQCPSPSPPPPHTHPSSSSLLIPAAGQPGRPPHAETRCLPKGATWVFRPSSTHGPVRAACLPQSAAPSLELPLTLLLAAARHEQSIPNPLPFPRQRSDINGKQSRASRLFPFLSLSLVIWVHSASLFPFSFLFPSPGLR